MAATPTYVSSNLTKCGLNQHLINASVVSFKSAPCRFCLSISFTTAKSFLIRRLSLVGGILEPSKRCFDQLLS